MAAVAFDELPDTIEVSLCGKTLRLPTQVVTDSMVKHLAKRAVSMSVPYDDMLNMFENDVAFFLSQQLAEKPSHPFPLFDEQWEEDFFAYKAQENKHLCQDVIVEFPDGSRWKLRALDLALLRAEHLLGPDQENSEAYTQERDVALKDPKILLEWISTNISWDDIGLYAEEIRRPQPEMNYADHWAEAAKTLEPWDDAILLLATKMSLSEESDEEDAG